MPKLKTHKGVARRVTISGTGKLMHAKAGRRHLLTGKSANKMRRLRRKGQIKAVNAEKLRWLLPYS